MLTKKVKSRIIFLSLFFFISCISVFFLLKKLNENILYFFTPTEIYQKTEIEMGKPLRIGGMVKKKSVSTNQKEIKFIITDFKNEINVSFEGTVPNLFAEGKGVVAEGKMVDKKFFIAKRILAKHDENYMPPKPDKTKQNVK
tara:strand:- start:88 stop:513 length:426 start_codon:yes stop_codon:yes gene_type:complete